MASALSPAPCKAQLPPSRSRRSGEQLRKPEGLRTGRSEQEARKLQVGQALRGRPRIPEPGSVQSPGIPTCSRSPRPGPEGAGACAPVTRQTSRSPHNGQGFRTRERKEVPQQYFCQTWRLNRSVPSQTPRATQHRLPALPRSAFPPASRRRARPRGSPGEDAGRGSTRRAAAPPCEAPSSSDRLLPRAGRLWPPLPARPLRGRSPRAPTLAASDSSTPDLPALHPEVFGFLTERCRALQRQAVCEGKRAPSALGNGPKSHSWLPWASAVLNLAQSPLISSSVSSFSSSSSCVCGGQRRSALRKGLNPADACGRQSQD